jgi:hypothetical protein
MAPRGDVMLDRLRRVLFRRRRRNSPFPGSTEYWERRYRSGGTSGDGSYGELAGFKAEVINDFVSEQGIDTVVELGCGDGNQLGLLTIPDYFGYDISKTAVDMCKELYSTDATKRFEHYSPAEYNGDSLAQLSLSLDIIFHLVEDDVFEHYMTNLFQMASGWVIIYSSDSDVPFGDGTDHCRNRRFTKWVSENIDGWELARKVDNRFPESSMSDFYFYRKTAVPSH